MSKLITVKLIAGGAPGDEFNGGELVPRVPNDEPAAVLLDLIQAERERLGSSKKRGKAKG